MKPDCLNIVQCANVRTLGIAQPHITPDDRTLPRTIAAHCEQSPRTLQNPDGQPASLKALAGAVIGAASQCANVRTPISAHSHNADEDRTLQRTLSAQSAQTPRTLPPHSDTAPHIATDARLAEVISMLESDPGLQYAMKSHEDIEPDIVILTVAIKDKGACEIHIPQARYDGIRLLELLEKHTRGEQ